MSHRDAAEPDPTGDDGLVVQADGAAQSTAPEAGTRHPAGWMTEGLRTALMLSPRWSGLAATPLAIIALIGFAVLVPLGLQRLWIVGPADFDWRPLLTGWTSTGLAAWVCYALRQARPGDVDGARPGPAQLFSLLLLQALLLSSAYGVMWAIAVHVHGGTPPWSATTLWGLWIGFWLWLAIAQTLLLWRSADRKRLALLLAALLLIVGYTESGLRDENFWVASADASSGGPAYLRLTQEVMEGQPRIFEKGIAGLAPQRKGTVDLYVLTFAPFAHEPVFRRESQTVAEVMAQRFDAAGRVLQLINHAETAWEWPWATPLNLQRAIQRVAAVMDRDEDILMLHLTSHGAQDGELAAQFWPLSIDAVTPQLLRKWLDEAGVHYRVVSVSACYSGSWVEPLRGEGTLVMTAADADNTSYGCGRKSELTYFGRAMFDEQLRRETRSFEAAHAAARALIAERERAAGKDDGYSNPQIDVGDRIRSQLDRLRQRLEIGAA